MKHVIGTLTLGLALTATGYGQANWLKVYQDPYTDYETREAAYKIANGTKKATRGSGMKQYERWRWMAQQRLSENGKSPGAVEMWNNYQLVKAQKNQKDIGDAWQQVGPIDVPFADYGNGIGRVNAIAFHPTDPLTLWAGSPSGGLWKTIDGGNTWTTNTDMLTNLGISDIVINPDNVDEMYLASGDRDGGDTEAYGVLKSTDGGQNWDLTQLVFSVPGNTQIHRLLMDSANTQTLYAATSDGIYKTTDGGANWVQKTSSGTGDLEFIPGSSTDLLAVVGSNVFRSADAGDSWQLSSTGIPTDDVGRIKLAVSPSDPEYAYLIIGNNGSGFRALCQSADSGSTWTVKSESPNILGYSPDGADPGGQAWYDLDIVVHPTNPQEIWIGGINTWKSTNGGTSWNITGHWTGDGGAPLIHADQHFLAFSPVTGKIWIGNDGGVWTLDNSGLWFIKSNKMAITQYYRFGNSKTSNARVIAGAQDNGTHFRKTVGWSGVIGGDGMEAMIDHENPDIVYGTIYYGSLYRSDDAGGSFIEVSPGQNGAWVTPFEMDPQDASTLYAGFDKVYVSYERGGSWAEASPTLTTGGDENLLNLAVPPLDNSIVYAARRQNIYKGVDFGGTWTSIKNNLPATSSIPISYINVDPFDPQTVYATLSGYSATNKVFKTTNGGQTWQNITGNLPNIAVFCIETEQSAERGIYIGTEYGVYFKDNTMSDWQVYGTDFPNVQVTELEITEQFNKLRACTYGRGVWEIDVQNTLLPLPVGIEELAAKDNSHFLISPNPGEGVFQITADEATHLNRLLIVGSTGMVLKNFSLNTDAKQVTFDVTDLPAGVYVARLISEKGITHHRFIKR